MLAPLRKPLVPPRNSRSSFASSTTKEGCRVHRARNSELSTLLGKDARRLQHAPGDPSPTVPIPNKGQEAERSAEHQLDLSPH